MFLRSAVATISAAGLAAATLLAPVAADAGAVFHKPRIPSSSHVSGNTGWSSTNWSGAAETGSGYTSITGKWSVPAVSATKSASYSSNWIGIDGYNNSNLIQTGTESDYYNGSAHYAVWWEILPAAETPIASMTVSPGDKMSASIVKGGGTSWTITINDDTKGTSFTTVQNYTGPGTSAEWIEEAPTVGGRVATLANYGLATFDSGTVNNGNPKLTAADMGVMTSRRGQISTPSAPDSDTDGFNVAYGPTAPLVPGS
ncbi:G1 family glutamic endopeptidase [Microbacterium sp. ASV49]|uniref:G1 family glutamic endopeptidase n=1 Tax=Microbacterium candidum TaxID=3041922 RepID=A0ABT7N268_9MICO|nr:G1 family glutamic endopeptidase [Microbacterium sp. ASV49]MDL9980808.1 G1 family glutamic endopeptidase [Microbacterium sp. ASV49]